MTHRAVLVCAHLLLLAGCAGKDHSLYHWGGYQEQIYEGFQIESSNTSPDKQLQKLEEEQQKAASKGKPLPPGYQAHMGYLYFQTGQLNKAAVAFDAEKKQFPESAVYMDLVLDKVKQK
ncbi:MAG: DUF4810 domain-containing protein [Limnohabitans sp.]|nr:DUF4810 domain-containing protein [Limnohabitans sp.]